MADGSPEGIYDSGPHAPEISPEHGERYLDGVQIRGVWRQEQEPEAALLEDRGGFRALVARKIVEDDDVAARQACRMHCEMPLSKQPGGKFGHGDLPVTLYPVDQRGAIRR